MENVNVGALNVEITGDNSDLKRKLNDTGKDLNKASGDVKQFGNNIGVLRLKLSELERTDMVGKTPQQVRQLEKEIASLRDEVGDYDARLKSMSLDPFQKMAQGVQALSSVMAGAAGVATLFGGNQEELNAIMQKTVALMGIAQAAQTAADFTKQNAIGIYLKDKYKELAVRIQEGLVIKTNTAATVAEAGAKEGLSGIQKVLIVLQNGWNKAVMAFPGAIIVAAIAALVTAGWGLYKMLGDNEEASNSLNTAIDGTRLATEEAVNAHNDHVWALQELEDEYLLLTGAINQYQADLNKLNRDQQKEQIKVNQETEKAANEQTSFWSSVVDGVLSMGNPALLLKRQMKKAADLAKEEKDKLAEVDELYEKRKQILAKREEQRLADEQKRKQDAADQDRDRLDKQKKDYEDFYNSVLNQSIQIPTADLKVNLELPSADELFGQFEDEIPQLRKMFIDVSSILSDSVTQGLNDVAGSFAEGIGNLAAGSGSMDDVFKGISESLANFMSSLGKSLIAAGIGAIAFKKLLIKPAAAIVAGGALVALAAAVKSKLASGPSAVSTGSYSYGGSNGGDVGTTATRTIFANEGNSIKVTGKLIADGKQLVAVLDSESKRLNK